MAQYLSNEGLLYGVIRRGKNIMATRLKFHGAMYWGGLDITFNAEYNPEFNLREGHWSEGINRTSSVYLDVMQSMYFDAYQVMDEKHYAVVDYEKNKEDRFFSPRRDVELQLQSTVENYGKRYYMSHFLAALLKTDFLERPDIDMPDYTHRNLG